MEMKMVREERNVEGALPMEVWQRGLKMSRNVEKLPRGKRNVLLGFGARVQFRAFLKFY